MMWALTESLSKQKGLPAFAPSWYSSLLNVPLETGGSLLSVAWWTLGYVVAG